MEITYGPIKSRRFGLSLGINLLGQAEKVCSFNCPYCDLGPSQLKMNQIRHQLEFISPEAIEQTVREKLEACIMTEAPLETICFSGNGEPTLHPEFLPIVESVLALRQDLFPKCKVIALTNGAHLETKKVVQALNLLDERVIKLDAGNDAEMKLMNAPLVRMNCEKLISGCKKLSDVIIQSTFVKGLINNATERSLNDWMEMIGIIRPKLVQICTINRPPAVAGVEPLDDDSLHLISAKLRRRCEIESQVFPQ